MDKILAQQPLKVPFMLVHSLWDQEDIYGAPAVYKAVKPKDVNNDKVFLVLGPWHHGQEIEDGSTLGALKFNADTSYYFQLLSARRRATMPLFAARLLIHNTDIFAALRFGLNRSLLEQNERYAVMTPVSSNFLA